MVMGGERDERVGDLLTPHRRAHRTRTPRTRRKLHHHLTIGEARPHVVGIGGDDGDRPTGHTAAHTLAPVAACSWNWAAVRPVTPEDCHDLDDDLVEVTDSTRPFGAVRGPAPRIGPLRTARPRRRPCRPALQVPAASIPVTVLASPMYTMPPPAAHGTIPNIVPFCRASRYCHRVVPVAASTAHNVPAESGR